MLFGYLAKTVYFEVDVQLWLYFFEIESEVISGFLLVVLYILSYGLCCKTKTKLWTKKGKKLLVSGYGILKCCL